MTQMIGVRIEPELHAKFKNYAKNYGTSVSALMRQATIEYIQNRVNTMLTKCQQEDLSHDARN